MADTAVPILLTTLSEWREDDPAVGASLIAAAERGRFKGRPGQFVFAPATPEEPERVIAGIAPGSVGAASFRALAGRLPSGDYRVPAWPTAINPESAALAWAAGAYRYDRYKSEPSEPPPRLVGVDSPRVGVISRACALARDLINAPANAMGPREMESAARALADRFGASVDVVTGDDLEAGYPAVHAVGRAAHGSRAPRIIELQWGDAAKPRVAIVGKGVVFDSGGLDIKPSAGMRWMKKDMGGAAHAYALAAMIMALDLPIRLCVLTPVVENAISGDAMRPGDILATRRGLSVEVGNTDAEGRLILADALTRAAEFDPVLTIDLATLTGAARVALGPEVVPFYTDDDGLAGALQQAAESVGDPIWRMPMWDGYAAALDSDLADLKNDADAWAQAGSITAALFLKRFAPSGAWAHFDIFGWNARSRPGYPQGGEAQAIRAIFAMLETRFPR